MESNRRCLSSADLADREPFITPGATLPDLGHDVIEAALLRWTGMDHLPWSVQGPLALSLCAAARPLHNGIAIILGAPISETTVRPNPRFAAPWTLKSF